jgi:hypothetical protein
MLLTGKVIAEMLAGGRFTDWDICCRIFMSAARSGLDGREY